MALLRYKLYEKYTKLELTEMIKSEENPKKSTEIAHAITFHLEDERRKAGTYVFQGGYSGRQSKRR